MPADETALRRSVSALRAVFPAGNDGEENARRIIGLYVSALASFPEWAVNEVCRQYLEGRRGNGTFAPPAPEMAKACREEVSKFMDERAKIEAVLEAEVLPPIDQEKAARAAAVMRWEKEIRPQMVRKESEQAQPTETPEQRLERHRQRANEPVVIGGELAKKLAEWAGAKA